MTFVGWMRRCAAAASIIFSVASTAAAQGGPVTIWRQTLDTGSGWSRLALDSKGAMLVSWQSGQWQTVPHRIVKYSAEGQLLWSVQSGAQRGFAIAVDGADDVIVGTETFVAKYDSNGALLWRIDTGYNVEAVVADAAGNAYFAGTPADAGTGDDVVRLTKVDPSGVQLWSRDDAAPQTPVPSNWFYAQAMALDAQGQLHVLYWRSYNSWWGYCSSATFTSAGELVAGSAVNDWGYPEELVIDSLGRPVIGSTWYYGSGQYDSWLGTPGTVHKVATLEYFVALANAKDGSLLVGAYDYSVPGWTYGSTVVPMVIERRSPADYSLLSKHDYPIVGDIAVDAAGWILVAGPARDTGTTEVAKISFDADGDGFLEAAECNDHDATVFPGAPETKHDGVDQDCNGYDLTIDVVKAVYVDGSVRVEATSARGAAAGLEVVGIGPMIWKDTQLKWVRNALVPDPGSVTVCGVEGCTSAPTTAE